MLVIQVGDSFDSAKPVCEIYNSPYALPVYRPILYSRLWTGPNIFLSWRTYSPSDSEYQVFSRHQGCWLSPFPEIYSNIEIQISAASIYSTYLCMYSKAVGLTNWQLRWPKNDSNKHILVYWKSLQFIIEVGRMIRSDLQGQYVWSPDRRGNNKVTAPSNPGFRPNF